MTGVCRQCARRAWLLTQLSVQLDFKARDLQRFWRTLELPDLELIQAVGGKRRVELQAAYEEWTPPQDIALECSQALCRHHAAYPLSLREDALAPHALEVRGGIERLATTLDEKVVAIVGTRRATDYGVEVARGLARGLAASGVTVASGLAEGIPRAALAGALEVSGSTLAVMANGVEHCAPALCAPLFHRILESGCAISETRATQRMHRWQQCSSIRTLALLAQLVIVVEAEDQASELACANVALSRGRLVAAVPGRVSSPASRGTHTLLTSGARLVTSPQDALDALYGVDARAVVGPSAKELKLAPRLAGILERVSGGEDTVARLTAHGAPSGEVAMALIELELRGLLVRGHAGRYVPCAADSWAADWHSQRL